MANEKLVETICNLAGHATGGVFHAIVRDEIIKFGVEVRNLALEEAAVLSDDVAMVRGEPNYKVLAARIRALKTGGSK